MRIFVLRPEKIKIEEINSRSNKENIKLAFDLAETEFNVTKLLDPEGFRVWFMWFTFVLVFKFILILIFYLSYYVFIKNFNICLFEKGLVYDLKCQEKKKL